MIAIATSGGGKGNDADSGKPDETVSSKQPVEYTEYTVSEMMADLDTNAMKASEKYDGKHVRITGRLANIDSDGKYIDIMPSDDDWALIGVTCYIKGDEQKSKIMDMEIGDTVTIEGEITDVGEVLGYYLDIENIK